MDFVTNKANYQQDRQTHNINELYQDQQPIQIIDKRSRSETPNKMSTTEVLFRAHQKLQMRRKDSPQKIMEKHQQRQKKAEELRAQIEDSKKKWYEKIRIRQQIAKQRWKELLAERKAKLQGKLEHAEERRETEIQTLKNKAKQEIQKIDETNYIFKMTMNNMKLDLDMKMTETQERRNQILEENKKKQHERHLKEEAAEKRRQELLRETENKFLTNKQKREQADQRRIQMLEQKKKVAQDKYRRIQVLERKNILGDKISDVMSFVSNSENIWEFLGSERDWQDLGFSNYDELLYELISKDQFELEKLKLKKDAEQLNKMIIIEEHTGRIYANKQYIPLIKKRKYYNEDWTSDDDDEEKFIEEDKDLFNTPKKDDNIPNNDIMNSRNTTEDKKGDQDLQDNKNCPTGDQDLIGCCDMSDGSDKDSIAEETPKVAPEEEANFSQLIDNNNDRANFDSCIEQQMNMPAALFDDSQNYLLYTNRIKMSMKRNVLKKTLSEDLTWADFLKNESYQNSGTMFPMMKNPYTRSMNSTPERKQEIPNESDKEVSAFEQPIINASSHSSIISNPNSNGKRGKKHHKNQHNSGPCIVTNQNQTNTSSSGNLSEKSRISSVVYPSKTKKNPKNTVISPQQQSNNNENTRNSGSFHSNKNMKSSFAGSNQSSTQSLLVQNVIGSGGYTNNDTPKNNGGHNQRKSVQLGDQDSSRKKQNARMHSSSVNESSGVPNLSQLIGSNQLINGENVEERPFETQSNTSIFHTGQQMSQLITNSKPILPLTKMVQRKLTINAIKMLFPLTQQKLLFKRPGKEGQFGKCKLTVKIEDLVSSSKLMQQQQTQTSTLGSYQMEKQVSFTINDSQIQNDIKAACQQTTSQTQISSPQTAINNKIDENIQDLQLRVNQTSTPSFNKRRESTDTNNSNTGGANKDTNNNNSSANINSNQDFSKSSSDQIANTPTQTSKLWQMHQKFWEKLQNNQGNTLTATNIESASQIKKKSIPIATNSNIPSENSPSPKKDEKVSKDQANSNTPNQSALLNNSQIETTGQMNEQGYKELIIKYLLTDNIQQLKTEDTQKTIFLEGDEGNKVIDYMEQHELQLRYCRLCDLILPDHSTNEAHVCMKSHKRTREDLGIKEIEDLQFSILSLQSQPGDIDKELVKEKEKALKRKVKRLKTQMIALSVSHDSASYCPGKEVTSTNKKRFQILCIDLEKQVIPIIKDYEALENTLKEIIKILEMRKHSDLHLMRKLKFIPILIEICKRISVCHKNEFKHLGKALDYVIKIINIFCTLRENRNYMLQTNRMSALIELLNWCLNRPTQLFYGINFMPQLFHILTQHVKHRAPYECQQMKEMFVEYLICSQITMKTKSKFQIINGPLDLCEMMGQVPLFLLKSATFLESLTSLISMDSRSRPVYEKSTKIAEHVLFVIQNTELFGIISMVTTILLSRSQPFKPSSSNQTQTQQLNILPQTILSLAITSIKIVNNVYRMDYRFAQQIMSDFEIQEQLYHLFNYILFYGVETLDKQEDSKELLHETILLIGYFSLNNEKNQAVLCKGENTLLQKLCNLPFTYFCDKKLKEILFPTLIQASYKNERSLAIMDQELSIEHLVDFIQLNMKEELPRIIEEECDQQSMSSVGHSAVERNRSPSISSTNSSQCSLQIDMINGNSPYLPLYMRFPKKIWKDAITFYSKVLY